MATTTSLLKLNVQSAATDSLYQKCRGERIATKQPAESKETCPRVLMRRMAQADTLGWLPRLTRVRVRAILHAEVASSAGLYSFWSPPQHPLACQLHFLSSGGSGMPPRIWSSDFRCSPHRFPWVHEEEVQDFLHLWGTLNLR